MAVGENLVVAFRDAGHIVHSRSPAAAPIGSIRPGAVQFPPLGIRHQGREHPVQAVYVSKLLIVKQFCPGKQVGARGNRIVALEAVRAVGPNLPADETVLVLLGIEVIQRSLEREEAIAVAGKQHHKTVVPHEDIAVVRHIQVRAHKAGAFLGLADIADGYLPGVPVHIHFPLVAFPEGSRQHLPGLLVTAGLQRFPFHTTVGILRHEDVLHVCILVRELIRAAAEVLRPRKSCKKQQNAS